MQFPLLSREDTSSHFTSGGESEGALVNADGGGGGEAQDAPEIKWTENSACKSILKGGKNANLLFAFFRRHAFWVYYY